MLLIDSMVQVCESLCVILESKNEHNEVAQAAFLSGPLKQAITSNLSFLKDMRNPFVLEHTMREYSCLCLPSLHRHLGANYCY